MDPTLILDPTNNEKKKGDMRTLSMGTQVKFFVLPYYFSVEN